MGIGRVSARTLARAALPLLIAIAGVVAALQLGQIERSREAARMQVRSGDAARAITGMGLSLVKKVAEARGGSVSVESAPGEGARFTVVLPAAAPDVPAIRAA